MADLMHYLTNLLFFDVPLLYCYTNLNSSIVLCLSSEDMHLFFGASISLLASSFCKHNKGILMHLLFYQQFCYQLNHQLRLLNFELLFLKQFLLHPS